MRAAAETPRWGMAKFNTPEERAALIDECKASGLTIAEFCRRRGVGYSTMFKWMGGAGTAGRENGSHTAAAEPAPRFVEVEMEGHENGAEARPVARPLKRQSRPAAALCAELLLPGGAVLRVYHNSSAEGGAA
jgi:transposase-like protein